MLTIRSFNELSETSIPALKRQSIRRYSEISDKIFKRNSTWYINETINLPAERFQIDGGFRYTRAHTHKMHEYIYRVFFGHGVIDLDHKRYFDTFLI